MTMNPFNPVTRFTLTVDKMIGTAYPHVEHVSKNIEYIKHVSYYLDKVTIVSDNIEQVLEFIEGLPELLADFEIVKQIASDFGDLNSALTYINDKVDEASEIFNNIEILSQTTINNITQISEDVETYSHEALEASNYAREWAFAPEDSPINDGTNPEGFSAYHWSKKAEEKIDSLGNVLLSDPQILDIVNTLQAQANIGPVKFDMVAGLLADMILSYSAASGRVSVAVGKIVEAQGYRYEVAASGASDHHVETAGGVKLYALPLPGGMLDVRQFGAGIGVQTARIQSALDAAAAIGVDTVLANDRQYLSDELNIPEGLNFRCDLKIATAATSTTQRNLLRVNPGCGVYGRIEGSFIVSELVYERGIYPAVNGCHDVRLDVDISGFTILVAPIYTDLNNPPRRWKGCLRLHDAAAIIPGSNGYGVNGNLCDSTLLIYSDNIPRHSLYLGAGASHNNITIFDRRSRAQPVDIASFDGQPPCVGNRIRAFISEHHGFYATGIDSAGCVVWGNSHDNDIEIQITDSAPMFAAAMTRAYSATSYPRNNRFDVTFDGEVTGTAIVDLLGGSGNRAIVRGKGVSSASPSAIVRVSTRDSIIPDNPGPVAATIDLIDFDAQDGIDHAVMVAVDYAKTDLGAGVIKARNLKGSLVNFFTLGHAVIGWINENLFSLTSSSINAGESGDVVVNFDQPLAQRRYIQYSILQPGVAGANLPQSALPSLSSSSMTIRIRNNAGSASTFTVSGSARGF